MSNPTFAWILGAAALVTLGAATAQAQVVGTFKWQTLPYCNVLTLTVVQQGGMYQLMGVDDLCSGAAAAATGTAVVTNSGVAMGVTILAPGTAAEHLTSTVNVATGNGTWSDADGHAGTFLFASGPGAGPPRPAPAAATAITALQLAPSIYAGTGSATTVARSDHTHSDIYPPAVSAPVSDRCNAEGTGPGGPLDGQFESCTSLTIGAPTAHSVLLIAHIGWGIYQASSGVKGECRLQRNGVEIPGSTVTMGETVKTTEESNAGGLINRRLNWSGVTSVSGPHTGAATYAVACRERFGNAQFNEISLSAMLAK